MSGELLKLGQRLLQTGILQFGYFEKGDKVVKWRLQSALLPSYPDLLNSIGEVGRRYIVEMSVDRFLCLRDSLPLAQSISLATQVPLVYEGNKTGNPVLDLVGAYDVGHPTCLIVNHASELDEDFSLLRAAERVGLQVTHVMALYGPVLDVPDHIDFVTLLDLPSVVQVLETEGVLDAPLAQSILQDMSLF